MTQTHMHPSLRLRAVVRAAHNLTSILPTVTLLSHIPPPHLTRLCRELKVGALHDGVHRARLLAEAAVDALGHVDVVPEVAGSVGESEREGKVSPVG